jgi:hypothetical protein
MNRSETGNHQKDGAQPGTHENLSSGDRYEDFG